MHVTGYVDSHCHLHDDRFADAEKAIAANAAAAMAIVRVFILSSL